MERQTRPGKRRSAIWLMPLDEFQKVIAESSTITEALGHFELQNKGGNFKTLNQRISEEGIDASHFIAGAKKKRQSCLLEANTYALSDVLVEGSAYNRRSLKKRLIEEGLLENKCAKCGQLPLWDGLPLVMVLDHINGVSDDNKIENLRLLCPNCHSQTDTFAGRNRIGVGSGRTIYPCSKCGIERKHQSKSGVCKDCAAITHKRKVENRPHKAFLEQQVKELGYCGTARLYGVSDNAVRKWLKN